MTRSLAELPHRSPRTAVRFVLVVVLLAAFACAAYLSYWANTDVRSAFAYQAAVVDAERDAGLLIAEQFERRATADELQPYRKLVTADLARIDAVADVPAQRAPAFTFTQERADYERLTSDLAALEALGNRRFDATVRHNRLTRDLSNAMFGFLALFLAVVTGRLRRALDEGRSLVERLQRAFISQRRELPNVDLGSVLISATRGSSVGGDTYDAFSLDGRYGMFLVADVSGKGIEAAVDTALIKFTLRTLFSVERDPGSILEKFGTIYARTAENPETFVVLFLAVVDLHSGLVRYAAAGHEPAWALRDGDVAQLAATGPIVGIEPLSTYETRALQLRPGDMLVVSTDGLTESRDRRRRLLGADGVAQWLAQSSGDAQAVADALVRRLRRRSRSITDDLAILVVRYAPVSAARMPRDAAPEIPVAAGAVEAR